MGKQFEIERKYLVDINKMPGKLEEYDYHDIEQAYLCTLPVVRIRKQDDEYILTYKAKGMMVREEYNLPLTKESYLHLLEKADGIVITKRRYVIPFEKYNIELDIFKGHYDGLHLAEVEFESEEEANNFKKPNWFLEDVTFERKYHNSNMSEEKNYENSSNVGKRI